MPIDISILKRIAPQAKPAILVGLAQFLDEALNHYDITGKRVVYFLGQAAEETDGFRTLVEYASGEAYNGRPDLGNTQPGDGPRFKGRGIFQLTGRDNYARYGRVLGVDFIDHPESAALPQYAVLTAGQYWSDHDLNPLADRDDIKSITKAINGGTLGWTDRVTYTDRAALALGIQVPAFA